ncbi:hypothetical protein [Aquisediminimonas profunda]|uniref:hypothetical protein n=1 Tax=Aquisediminimonas profunda TaxID=1550733 RepID=UPI001C63912E|nr:hypothetical protein [Aquisediminimonas profunda]
MKRLLLGAALLLPTPALAESLDVIQVKLKSTCSLPTYLGIVADFNTSWGKAHGYNTRIAVPLHSNDLTIISWLGTTANAEVFGKAWDAWRDAQRDANSTAAKLQARFNDCGDNVMRRSYDVF